MNLRRYLTVATMAALTLSACSPPANGPGAVTPGRQDAPSGVGRALSNPIKHVVIVIQENRSFDSMFGAYPGADGATSGVDNAGATVPLHPTAFQNGTDLGHSWQDAVRSWDYGKMDRFDLEKSPLPGGVSGMAAYSYVPNTIDQAGPYWTMAQQYVLADHMFPTEFGSSFTSHLNLVAGTSQLTPNTAVVNIPTKYPWGCDAPKFTVTQIVTKQRAVKPPGSGPYPCFSAFATMADIFDDAGVKWRYYAPAPTTHAGQQWSAFSAIANVHDSPRRFRNVVSPETTILTDAANGTLAQVSWVVPQYYNSDHPGNHSALGPSWVASIVNAIGQGPDWNSTAIVVVWDEWGGLYDHVKPPQLDFRGLGIRVPCLIISPYSKHGFVSHTQYESGSILKYVEQTFGLPFVADSHQGWGYTDERANSLMDSFDFTQKPRPFQVIPAPQPGKFFQRQAQAALSPDDD